MSQEIRQTIQTLPLNALAYEDQFPEEYQALKTWGFSPFYALRILVEFKRGDQHAATIIKLCKESNK